MENPETLADGGVSSESPKAQIKEEETINVESRVSNETLTEQLASEVPVDGVQENGIRVSMDNNGGVAADATTRMEVLTSVLDKEKDGTGIGDLFQDDGSRMTAASTELQEFGSANENTKKIVEGDVSVTVAESGTAVNENKESGVAQISPEIVLNGDGTSQLSGGDSATKIEVSGDDVNVTVVESGSAVNENKENSVAQISPEIVSNGDGSTQLNDGDSGTKIEVAGDGVPLVVEIHGSCEAYEKSCEGNNNVFKPGGGLFSKNGVEGKEEEEVDGEEEEQEVNDQENEFSVGDFVWGKIKSHPWWPGQIYDPSDASKFAAKCHRRDRLLVGYFGDGTFAWCYPSQLKPFKENFEHMWKQSNSKSFVNAIQEAVNEIGRRVESEMTCACVPAEIRSILARPLAVNAGIKEGVSVPDGGIGDLTITQFEPAKFLAYLRDVAEVVSMNSILEHKVLCSRLSALYGAKGYRQLPIYYEADGIACTEDCAVNEEMHKNILDDRKEELNLHPAEVEWISSPVGPEISKFCKRASQRWPGSSEDKLYQRKKQKSMAEILAGDVNVDHQKSESNAAGEVISGKPASSKKKRKKNHEDGVYVAEYSGGNNIGLQTKKLKKMKLSVSVPNAEKNSPSIDNEEGADEASVMSSSPRMRKKSKYLSAPYTELSRGNKSLNSPRESQTESPKAKKVSSIGECIRRDADQLTGTPPIVRCSGQTFQTKPSKESDAQRKTYGSLSPRTPNSGNYKYSSLDGNASVVEMFSAFVTMALDPFYLKGRQQFDTFKSFFSRYRSSVYRNKSKFKMDNEQLAVQGSRKRKSLESNLGSSGQDSHATDRPSSESNPKRKRKEMKESFSRNPKNELPQVDGTSGLKMDHSREETKDESYVAAALLLTFSSGFSLPSKDDLITIFGKFGALNEKETEVLKDSNCAKVAFVRSSDAKEAFNSSQKVSPFGDAVVNYRLRYSSAIAEASARDESSHQQPSLLPTEGNDASGLPADGAQPLVFLKQNLEMMTSVLENSGEKILPGLKANLEGDIKGLLKKLNKIDESSSS